MQHLVTFVLSEGTRYWDLEPRSELLTPNRHGPVASYDGWSYCAVTRSRDLVLLYMEKGTPETTLHGLKPKARYTALWFDPRSGEWKAGIQVEANGDGKLLLPSKPTESDWALKLKHTE